MSHARLLKTMAAAAALWLPLAMAHASSIQTLYSFSGGADGSNPGAALTKSGPYLYGTTVGGGASAMGTLFRLKISSGALTTLHAFASGADGAYPRGPLLSVPPYLYGTTAFGGTFGYGTIFRLDPATGETKTLYHFNGSTRGGRPFGGLTKIGGGLFGTTNIGGAAGAGTLYRYAIASGAVKTLYNFNNSADGGFPASGLIHVGPLLYGTTSHGGSAAAGTVFTFDTVSHVQTVIHNFLGGTDGANPSTRLLADGGFLYGTTSYGGTKDNGVVFKLDPVTGDETVLHTFTGGADGATPQGEPIINGGMLYGTAWGGSSASGHGLVYKIDLSNGAETILHEFTGGADGNLPNAAVLDVGGNLYGTTYYGGPTAPGNGVVFKLTP